MKNRIKTSTVVLLSMGIFYVVFIIAMVVIYCIFQSTPEVLIQCVLGTGGIESVALAGIKIAKVIKEKKEKKENETDNSDDCQEIEFS